MRRILNTVDRVLEYCILDRPIIAILLLSGLLISQLFPARGISGSGPFYEPTRTEPHRSQVRPPDFPLFSTAPELLFGRPYFDRFPLDPRKTYRIYVFTDGGTGAYITSTGFKQVIEVFSCSISGDSIRYYFPHSRNRGSTGFTLSSCSGPGTFDLRLRLAADPKHDGRPRSFYSWRRYKRDSKTDTRPHGLGLTGDRCLRNSSGVFPFGLFPPVPTRDPVRR